MTYEDGLNDYNYYSNYVSVSLCEMAYGYQLSDKSLVTYDQSMSLSYYILL